MASFHGSLLLKCDGNQDNGFDKLCSAKPLLIVSLVDSFTLSSVIFETSEFRKNFHYVHMIIYLRIHMIAFLLNIICS